MAENESFFRKVVRFVANPATDWVDLSSRQAEAQDLELEKSELKAMIERKRRNDFVRKREFDMLRRIRREGLTPEQIAALGGSSRLDDSEARLPDKPEARPDAGVKAKIDEIEQQMVGDGGFASTRRAPPPVAARAPIHGGGGADDDERLPALPPLPDADMAPAATPAPVQMSPGLPPLAPPAPRVAPAPLAPLAPLAASAAAAATTRPAALGGATPPDARGPAESLAVEVNEAVHDPELDEAVIAFANAEFQQTEQLLARLTGAGGARAQHAETWLVLFDLYRATGQQQRFESLALEYAHQFGWSAPQWYSLPKLVAEAIADEPLVPAPAAARAGDVGWVCPELLDTDAVVRLRSQTLQLPLPWVFEFGRLKRIDAEAAMQLSTLLRLWAGQAIEMRWIGGERLLQVLAESAPTGVRDADPVFWLTRLDALRLANRADQFDEAAIDYCVTYEVSPPSWEPARCKVYMSGSTLSTLAPPMSVVSEVSTGFLESSMADEAGGVAVAHVELSGQLMGDIGPTLDKLTSRLGSATVVQVSCARLIRVDFIAAGDLLNWVLARGAENRSVQFIDANRLVALFFGAMGIDQHAKVQVRRV
ncbi:MAG: STAS domain-containing protein [Rubrivivax sp.]